MRTQRWVVLFLSLFISAFFRCGAFAEAPQKRQASKPTKPSTQVSPDESSRLPVKRVVLYKNGVGYFEHSARVRGNQDLGIDFTTSQLNDVLKSLTVVDLGDGHISGVRYNSIAPLEERLKTLRLPFGEQITRVDFLSAMRGSRVEVRSGSPSAVGRLLSVEQEQRTTEKGSNYQVTEFSVMTDSGEMRNFELGPAVSVRLADRELNEEVGRYLNLVGSSRARDLRRMSISASGSGEREIFVSYISEVPVWKSTYRIILPEKPNEKPLLQGWAIVDNTIGEDWKDVQLSLIAGAPQSFIQDISQPLYGRRPVIALPESAMLTPQTHEATMSEESVPPGPSPIASPEIHGAVGNAGGPIGTGSGGGIGGGSYFRTAGKASLEGTATDPSGATVQGVTVILRHRNGTSETAWTDSAGRYKFYSVAPGSANLTFQGSGFSTTRMNINLRANQDNYANTALRVGNISETVEVSGVADSILAPGVSMPINGRNFDQLTQFARLEQAQAQDLGDYFEYNLKQSITIGKNQSALVPILQSRIEAEKVTLWTANGNQRPLRALWIKNASGLILDAGTFNIIDSGTFAGEGLIETVHPDERRLLSYAADTAVRITAEPEYKDQPVSHVRVAKGTIFITREQRSKVKYTVRNSDTATRQIVIEHPVRNGWKLVREDKPEETSASHYRFRVAVQPAKTSELTVEEFHPEETLSQLTDLTNRTVDYLSVQNRMTPALQEAFSRVLDQKNKISDLQSQTETRQQELAAINKDQARIRENMKALKGSAEEKALLQRYTKQLDSQEDRLNTLNKDIAGLQQKQAQEQQKLDEMVQQITLDETF